MNVNSPFEGEDFKPGGLWGDATLASFEALEEASKGRATAFVWPDEGRFKKTGLFEFNDEHRGFEPLLIDATSSRVMLAVYACLKETNQAKFREFIAKDRACFGAMFDFAMERVTIVGFTGRQCN